MGKSVGLHACLLALLLVALSHFAWVGYIASDDMVYIAAARGWFEHFPYLPANHFAVRHTLNIPMGLAFKLFGFGEWQAVSVTLGHFAALAALVYLAVRARFQARTALTAGGLLVATPLFAVQSTIPGVDLVEAFYAFASLLLFLAGVQQSAGYGLLFGAGLAAGLALLSRETAAALPLFYAALFIKSDLLPRRRYWPLALGFLLPPLAETLYYLALTGDPLHRAHTVLTTQGPPTPPVLTGKPTGPAPPHLKRLLMPVRAMFINQEFGLLFWLAVPAAWFTCFKSLTNPAQRQFLRLLLGLGLLWIWVALYALGLWPQARYFSVATVAAVVIVAVWLSEILPPSKPAWAYGLLAALVASNLAMIDLENKQPRLAERDLAERLAANPGLTLYTDPETASRAQYMMAWQGADPARAIAEPPPPGGLFLYSKTNLQNRGSYDFDPQLFKPRPDWVEVERTRGKPSLIGSALNCLGLGRRLAGTPLERIVWANPPVVLYRNAGQNLQSPPPTP